MNNKVIIGPIVLSRDSETSISIMFRGQDNKVNSCTLNLSEASELAQTIINWVFKAILG